MKFKSKKNMINTILIIIAILLVLVSIPIIGLKDLNRIINWYIILLLMTIIGLPLTLKLFKNFYDKGYIFSKTIGILVSSYLIWLLSSLHILKFSYINSLMCTLILLIISTIIFIRSNTFKKKIINKKNILEYSNIILRIEIIFFIIFIVCSYIKGFNPDANSTEKFMDYGYMAIIDKTEYMPPEDLWFSGKSINYYYYGQYISTFLTKISKVKVNYGYNLMLITLFSITFLESFSIAYNILFFKQQKNKKTSKKPKKQLYLGGLIAALAITIAGNFHYVIYNLIMPFINRINGITTNNYYFSNSTRYIGYNPPTTDKTIHEFPSYSFILGDLHAHVINIIIVLLLIGLLLSYFMYKNKNNNNEEKNNKTLLTILICSLLGIYKMTNYWDFIIYFVVVILIFILKNIKTSKKIKKIIFNTIKELILIITISTIISLPFMNKFHKMILGVKFVPTHTKFYQLLVLWGLPISLLICYIVITIKNIKKKEKNIFKIISNINDSDLFMIVIGICALGLIIIPEIVYVVDIYIGSVRANTMFKLTYQSFIMFGLCFGYFIPNLIINKKKSSKILGYIFLILFTLTLGYSYTSTKFWFGNINNYKEFKTLNAMNFFDNSFIINMMSEKEYINPEINMKDDLEIIKWLNKNTNKNDTILETYGESYTFYNRISTFTGLATPMGWQTHEWLWRTTNSTPEMPKSVSNRIKDVETIYSSNNIKTIKRLINKYNIKYIIVGYNERIRYTKGDNKLNNEELLKTLGNIVFKTNNNKLNNKSYIIKIK